MVKIRRQSADALDRPFDPRSREKIITAYERARRADPTLTGPKFMWAVPEMRERFKSQETAGAYLRVLRQGRRTGGELYRAAERGKEKGLYQIQFRVRDSNQMYSQNLSVANAQSSFDIAAIEAELRTKRRPHLQALVDRFRARYGMADIDIDVDRFEVRQIATQQRPVYRMAI